MEQELYIKQCCIDKKLPKMLRENEGRMITFYSQGEWHVEKLWDAVSHMVSNVIQSNDPEKPIVNTGGKIHMLLVLPNLDRPIMETILRYKKHLWFNKLTVVCHTSSLTMKQIVEYDQQLASITPEAAVTVVIGKRAAAQQSLWFRWDDKTKQSLLVSGPMFTTKVGNPPFATYTATFIDSANKTTKEPINETPSQQNNSSLICMTTDIWRDIIGQDL